MLGGVVKLQPFRDTLNKSGEGFSGSCRGISGKSPSFRNRFPGCSALPFRPGGAVAGFDRPVWPPASGFGHNCAYVSRSVDSPPSAGCPVQKAAPDAPCSSPAPGSAPPLSRGQALGVAEYPLHLQERVLHLGRLLALDALRLSANASALPGSSFRRFPGRIATCHSTSRPKFSSRLWTP